MQKFRYTDPSPPHDYRCSVCDTHGVKLWRQSHTFLDNLSLKCKDCIKTDGLKWITASGYLSERSPMKWNHVSDQFYDGVPAVPTECGETFWGYTSVPQEGCVWWGRLPTGNGPLDVHFDQETLKGLLKNNNCLQCVYSFNPASTAQSFSLDLAKSGWVQKNCALISYSTTHVVVLSDHGYFWSVPIGDVLSVSFMNSKKELWKKPGYK